MASVLLHQQHSHVARGGRHTGPYQTPAGASALVRQMCKGSGIKYVVHTLPSGLKRGCTVVTWAVTPIREPSVPADLTLGGACSVHSTAGASAHSTMEDMDAENTWQEDQDMPDASLTQSALVHVVSQYTHGDAGECSHSGLGPPPLVLAVRLPAHSQLSQSLLHKIMWHEADSVAQKELEHHLTGGADIFANALPHYTWQPDNLAIFSIYTRSEIYEMTLSHCCTPAQPKMSRTMDPRGFRVYTGKARRRA